MAGMIEADHGLNSELFSRFEGFIFNNVVLVPGFSDVLPDMVDTTSGFTPTMDKVTEAHLAIAMVRSVGLKQERLPAFEIWAQSS